MKSTKSLTNSAATSVCQATCPTNSEPGALFSPSIDVIENDKALEITTDLPGVSEKDVEVTIVDNMLTVEGDLKPKRKKRKTTTA